MLRILAIAPEDGWAYVRSNNKVYLVRPPYTKMATSQVDEPSLENAISSHGFFVVEKEFTGWKELIGFLHQQILVSRRLREQDLADSGFGERFLSVASVEDLFWFLSRVEDEFLPQQKWDHAENLLLKMLGLSKVREDSELNARTIGLFIKMKKEKEETYETIVHLTEADYATPTVSPLADRRYGKDNITELANRIAERGIVFDI